MKTQILEKLNDLKANSGKSYEDVHAALGYATSTVHRWHKGESEPDLAQLTALVEFYGGSMDKLFAAVGKQEMAATQTIGYQGADAMVEHYEQRLKSKDEKCALMQQHHADRIKEINDAHKLSVEYLKNEIERLRRELDIANTAATDLTGKKSIVFWVLGAVSFLEGAALIVLAIILLTR